MDRLKLQESMNANGLENNYRLGTSMLSLAKAGRQPSTNSYAAALANAKSSSTDSTKKVGKAPNPHVQIKPHKPFQERFPKKQNSLLSLSEKRYTGFYYGYLNGTFVSD